MRKIASLFLVAFAVAAVASAHAGHSHRLMGTVKELHANQLTVTDAKKADHTVELDANTKLEKDGKVAKQADLQPGVRVSIHLDESDKVAVLIKIGGSAATH
jgi:hypothetical protein